MINLKEKIGGLFSRIKQYDYRRLLNTKAFLIVGCMTLVGIAILVGTLVRGGGEIDAAGTDSGKYLGNPVLVDNQVDVGGDTGENTGEPVNKDDYFAVAVINREQVRGEALDVLQEIADSPDAMADAKKEALDSINALMADMTIESNIETLIKAKGFEDCVAILSGESCRVIVGSDGLLTEEVAQILEIICEQSGLDPLNIKVMPK